MTQKANPKGLLNTASRATVGGSTLLLLLDVLGVDITRIEPLDAIGSTRRRRRGRICCGRRTATCQHVAAVVLHVDGRLLRKKSILLESIYLSI